MWLIICYTFFSFGFLEVKGYGSGAPPGICDSMTPKHRDYKSQTNQLPYTIKTKNTGIDIEVELIAPANDNFRGFFIQARDARTKNQIINGKFVADENSKLVACNNIPENAVTHSSSKEKEYYITKWTPPPGFSGDIIFRATLVRNARTFWINNDTPSLYVVQNEKVTTTGSTGPQVPTGSLQTMYERCGKDRGCFGSSDQCVQNSNCQILLSYTYDSVLDQVEFEIASQIGSNTRHWIAAGLSKDAKMGEDSVGDCIFDNGQANFQSSWNIINAKANEVIPQGVIGIEPVAAEFQDGVLKCTWRRSAVTVQNGITFSLLNDTYFILLAIGNLQSASSVKEQHYRYAISSTAANLTSVSLLLANRQSNALVKLHGSLMVIAWIGFIGVGILIARHYKPVWGEKTMCNVKIWFAIHRSVMVLSVLLIIISFIIIFAYAGEWRKSAQTHAILGCISTTFAIFQPIGALFRPGPDDSKRPIFNWLHRLGGNIGQIFAIATIFLAATLPAAYLPTAFTWVVAIYVAFYIIFNVWIEVYLWQLKKKKSNEINMMDLATEKTKEKTESSENKFKKTMLVIYAFPVIGLLLALVLIICLN